MNWIVSNLDIILGVFILVCFAGMFVFKFITMGKEAQIEKIQEWLLYAVIQAEKDLGGGTGQVKLRYVYDMFVEKFKFISMLITFEQFSSMVDESLDIMREMLTNNEAVKELVGGDK